MSRVESEEDFKAVMAKIRDFRLWAYTNKIDPWSVRHGLLIALEMDTTAALTKGVKGIDLFQFDQAVKKDTKKWIQDEMAQK